MQPCSIIHKLRRFNISGFLLKWIKAFVYCRSQLVFVKNRYSSWAKVISGGPKDRLQALCFLYYILMICVILLSMEFSHSCMLTTLNDILFQYLSIIVVLCKMHFPIFLCGLMIIWQLQFNVSKVMFSIRINTTQSLIIMLMTIALSRATWWMILVLTSIPYYTSINIWTALLSRLILV